MLSEEDKLLQNFLSTTFNLNKRIQRKDKDPCKYSIILYTTTVSDV